MATSAEQLYHGQVRCEPAPAAAPAAAPQARLFIDLDVCATGECGGCTIQCSYRHHPENNGIYSVAELATYYLVCRRCEEPHCVNACPTQALEQQPDKGNLLVRHTLRCISCKSCSHACPYGTIYPEHVPILAHNCDFCLGRRSRTGEPLCVATCPAGALKLMTPPAVLDQHTFLVGDNLIVHSTHWDRDQA